MAEQTLLLDGIRVLDIATFIAGPAAATVLGAVPLAISTGAGSESRSAIGWVIVGGMAIGTLFTLFVIPVAYTYIVGERRLESADETGGGTVAHTPAEKA